MIGRLRVFTCLPLAVLFLAPLVLSVALMADGFGDAHSFHLLFSHPQFPGALLLSLFTGLCSTALSLALALAVVASARKNLAAQAGIFLAVPHLSLALGLSLLIMPAGFVARLIALLFTGWSAPPSWVTTQDPLGLSLIAALVLKETPFLVWAFASLLNREDLRLQFAGQQKVARSLGHHPRSVFLKVIAPQLLRRSVWPIVAVLAYGLTVVDMALVIGPTQPPTLAQMVWTDINDGDPVSNARGAAGVLVLTSMILILLLIVFFSLGLGSSVRSRFCSWRPATVRQPIAASGKIWSLWWLIYALILLLLLLQSIGGLWPFPKLMPETFTLKHWARLWANATPVLNSLVLALATAVTALVAAMAWLEGQPERRDRLMLWSSTLLLCLPALVIGLGQYRMFLRLGITGTPTAMFLAHILPVVAYVFILLQGPYRSYDGRFQAMAAGMGKSRMAFLAQIKWPMLKAPLLSAFAVGFAVSMAQFVPAQLASAGRYTTLPMEAVTLTSGGNRQLTAAYGLALALLPLLIFVAAGLLGRPRWSGR